MMDTGVIIILILLIGLIVGLFIWGYIDKVKDEQNKAFEAGYIVK